MRTEHEIREQQSEAVGIVAEGESRAFSLSYEEGVLAALDWVLGITDDQPIETDG